MSLWKSFFACFGARKTDSWRRMKFRRQQAQASHTFNPMYGDSCCIDETPPCSPLSRPPSIQTTGHPAATSLKRSLFKKKLSKLNTYGLSPEGESRLDDRTPSYYTPPGVLSPAGWESEMPPNSWDFEEKENQPAEHCASVENAQRQKLRLPRKNETRDGDSVQVNRGMGCGECRSVKQGRSVTIGSEGDIVFGRLEGYDENEQLPVHESRESVQTFDARECGGNSSAACAELPRIVPKPKPSLLEILETTGAAPISPIPTPTTPDTNPTPCFPNVSIPSPGTSPGVRRVLPSTHVSLDSTVDSANEYGANNGIFAGPEIDTNPLRVGGGSRNRSRIRLSLPLMSSFKATKLAQSLVGKRFTRHKNNGVQERLHGGDCCTDKRAALSI